MKGGKERRTVPKSFEGRILLRLVGLIVLIISLEQDRLLRPDQWPSGLEVQVGLGAVFIGGPGGTDGPVDELFDGVGAVGDFPCLLSMSYPASSI